MLVDEHVLDLIPAYALGILDDADARRVSVHLDACASCRTELRAYSEVVDALPLAVTEFEPPGHLKESILRQARLSKAAEPAPQPGWWQMLKKSLSLNAPAWGMVGLALVLLLGASNLFLWQRLDRVEMSYQQMADQYLNTLRTVPLEGTEFTPDATGLLVISLDGEHGTLVVDRLPVLDETQQYQLWLTKDGERTSGGVFSVDEGGYGAKWIGSPEPLASYRSFGVTIEPAGGSPGPTGEKVLGGDL